jgi:hypothetical protein
MSCGGSFLLESFRVPELGAGGAHEIPEDVRSNSCAIRQSTGAPGAGSSQGMLWCKKFTV